MILITYYIVSEMDENVIIEFQEYSIIFLSLHREPQCRGCERKIKPIVVV